MNYELICEDFKLTDSIKTTVEENIKHIYSASEDDLLIHVYISEPTQKVFKTIMRLNFKGKEVLATKEGNDLYKLIGDTRKLFEKNLHVQMKRISDRAHGRGA